MLAHLRSAAAAAAPVLLLLLWPLLLVLVPADMRMMPIRSESNQIKHHKTRNLNV